MVDKIDKVRVAKGRLIRVVNTERVKFSRANSKYISLQVEDADGGNERCLLFTERAIQEAENRAKRNPEDLTTKSLLTDIID